MHVYVNIYAQKLKNTNTHIMMMVFNGHVQVINDSNQDLIQNNFYCLLFLSSKHVRVTNGSFFALNVILVYNDGLCAFFRENNWKKLLIINIVRYMSEAALFRQRELF